MATAIIGNIKGVKGDKGDQGLQGVQGVKGDKGDKGDNGEDFTNISYSDHIEAYFGFPEFDAFFFNNNNELRRNSDFRKQHARLVTIFFKNTFSSYKLRLEILFQGTRVFNFYIPNLAHFTFNFVVPPNTDYSFKNFEIDNNNLRTRIQKPFYSFTFSEVLLNA